MPRATFVETSDLIDLTTWGFADGGPLQKAAAEMVTEVLREQFEETPPHLDFPMMYGPDHGDGSGGPAVEDHLTIYIALPLSASDDDAIWSCSLADLIDDVIEFNPGAIERLQRLAAALRAQVDKLEAAVRTAVEKQLSEQKADTE